MASIYIVHVSITRLRQSKDQDIIHFYMMSWQPPQEHDCELTRELVSLIDREADLLVRDLRPQAMAGLRKRIANLFFQYCRTPLFNPEAAKHIRVFIKT